MAINDEMDAALTNEMRKMATAPRDSTFLIVLNTEGQNAYLEYANGLLMPVTERGKLMIERKHRGATVAITHDPDMPRVSVFAKAN